MLLKDSVFIATSSDGFIADEGGGIEWLKNFPPPPNGDGGFAGFRDSFDAVVMGRNTFEKVLSLVIEWLGHHPAGH